MRGRSSFKKGTRMHLARHLLSAAAAMALLVPQAGRAADSFSSDASGFVMLTEVVPDAVQEIRYYTPYNFVGERIDGYEAPCALLTKEAAAALRAADDEFLARGYRLKIYDAYRPHKAVRHFLRWSRTGDSRMQPYFYPHTAKAALFARGYIAEKSGHSRGSAVDLTLIDMASGKDVDMGGHFDLFDDISHTDYGRLSAAQARNRKLLRTVMQRHGFKPIRSEWWHFVLADEPYPHTYFTFPVAPLPEPACPDAAQAARLRVARRTDQLILVGATGTSASDAVLALYERQGHAWRRVLAVPARIGKEGLGKTREGDNKTPTGVYRFTRAFGIAPDPGSRMPYTRLNDSHYWVGDSASPLYNRFASVVGGDAPFDTTQSEHLIDYAQAYRYCLSISYNEAGQPGRGSAIFLHCYPENPYTGGCIAVPEEAMKTIMRRVHEKCLLIIDRRENLASY